MRKRKIVKYGGSYSIQLAPVDMKDFNIQEGDEIDIESILVVDHNNKKRKIKK